MGRPLGSGTKDKYVSFRTTLYRYEAMIKLGTSLGLNKSQIYRKAERELLKAAKTKP